MLGWILKNKEWIFSGIGVLIAGNLITYLFRKNRSIEKDKGLSISGSNENVVIQAGGSVENIRIGAQSNIVNIKNLEHKFIDTAWEILSCFEQLQIKVNEGSQNDPSGTELQDYIMKLCWTLRDLTRRLVATEKNNVEDENSLQAHFMRIYNVIKKILDDKGGSLNDLESAIKELEIISSEK